MKLSEERLEDFTVFLEKAGYSPKEKESIIQSVEELDEESSKWFVKWQDEDELPDKKIEGITAKFLMDYYKMTAVNALIVLDWLKKDPETAKYFLLKNPQASEKLEL